MKKITLLIIVLIFLAFLGWKIFSLITKSEQSRPRGQGRAVAVETTNVEIKPIKEIREFTGTVYPVYKYIISPKVSGRVVNITKRIGDWVKKGEVIARLDDAEYQQSLLEAKANLKIAKASLAESEGQFELAKQELERVRSLQEKGISSSSELDNASTGFNAQKSRLELARAQVEQREAALKSAEIRLNYTVLTVSEPGFIGERFTDEGSLLSPNSPLVSIIGIDSVIVQATIIEKDYGRIKVGQPAEIKVDAFPETIFKGRVARIAPILEEASRVAKMEVEVENKDHLLKPGMFTIVRVVLQERDVAQVIPISAIIKNNGKDGIFIVEKDSQSDGNIARFYPIETGIASESETEVIFPEIKGPVVILGQHLLQDGSPVFQQSLEDKGPVKISPPHGSISGFQKTEPKDIKKPEEEKGIIQQPVKEKSSSNISSVHESIPAPENEKPKEVKKLEKEGARFYLVSGDESLSSIAARKDVYGNPLKWILLYRFNRDKFSNIVKEETFPDKYVPTKTSLIITSPIDNQKTSGSGADKDHWVINVLSSPEKEKIAPAAIRLVDQGYPAYITSAKVKGQDYIRLRVGFYDEKSIAENEAQKIAALLKLSDIWTSKAGESEFSEFSGYK